MKITDYTFPLRTTKLDGTKVEIKDITIFPDSCSGNPGKPVTFRFIKRGRPSWIDGDISEFVWPSGLEG